MSGHICSLYKADLRLQILKDELAYTQYITGKRSGREPVTFPTVSEALLWSGGICAESWFSAQTPACVVCDLPALCERVAVLFISRLSSGMQSRSILVPRISHQYFTPSLLSFSSSFSPPLFPLNKGFIYAPPHSIEGLAVWNPSGMLGVASGAIKKLPLPDGCKQSFLLCFLLYLLTIGWPTKAEHMFVLFKVEGAMLGFPSPEGSSDKLAQG